MPFYLLINCSSLGNLLELVLVLSYYFSSDLVNSFSHFFSTRGFFCMFSWYESIKKINVTPYRYVFTRFLRVFTVSVMVILLTFIMPLISSGPYYLDFTKKCTSNCAKNFWKNLLFINNQGSFLEIVSSFFFN